MAFLPYGIVSVQSICIEHQRALNFYYMATSDKSSLTDHAASQGVSITLQGNCIFYYSRPIYKLLDQMIHQCVLLPGFLMKKFVYTHERCNVSVLQKE